MSDLRQRLEAEYKAALERANVEIPKLLGPEKFATTSAQHSNRVTGFWATPSGGWVTSPLLVGAISNGMSAPYRTEVGDQCQKLYEAWLKAMQAVSTEDAAKVLSERGLDL